MTKTLIKEKWINAATSLFTEGRSADNKKVYNLNSVIVPSKRLAFFRFRIKKSLR